MTLIYQERTARKVHCCGWGCGIPIAPGEQYVMSSLTPGDSDIGNLGWHHEALHGTSLASCPDSGTLPP
jgi:isochorismate hydrolase